MVDDKGEETEGSAKSSTVRTIGHEEKVIDEYIHGGREVEDLPAIIRFFGERSRRKLRKPVVYSLLAAFGFAVLNTTIIIYLYGFSVFGFNLPPEFLHWLGAATFGEIAGLLLIAMRYLFSHPEAL